MAAKKKYNFWKKGKKKLLRKLIENLAVLKPILKDG